MSASLTSKVVRGVSWMAGARVAVQFIGFLSTLVLARVLVPADFGVVAVTMSTVALLSLFTSFSFDIALIQHQNLDRGYLDTVWTFTLLFSLFVGAGMCVLAEPAAAFYRDERLANVMYVVGASQALVGLANVGTVLFRKDLDFRRDFMLQVGAKLAGFVVSIPLALLLRSYWALVAGMVATNLANIFMSYRMHPHRPRWSLERARELMSFSVWLLINNTFNFLRYRSADLIVGRLLGLTSVGIFGIASQVTSMASTELVSPINRVLYPAYVKLVNDSQALGNAVARSIGMIAMLTLPACIGLSAVADLLVPVVLGAKWLSAIPILQALAIYGALNSLQTNIGSVLNALGQPRWITLGGVVQLGTLVPMLIFAAHHGDLVVVAWTFVAHSAFISFPVTYTLLSWKSPTRFSAVLAALWRPIAAAGVMYCGVYLVRHGDAWFGTLGLLPQLLLAVAAGALIYPLALLALWRLSGRPAGAERQVLDWVLPRLKRWAPT